MKTQLPVAGPAVMPLVVCTVAVNVTDEPKADGLADEFNTVVVTSAVALTVCAKFPVLDR